MIPDIGLIVAAYTIPRLIAMIGKPSTDWISKFLLGPAVLATVVALVDLIMRSSSVQIPQ
jgi:hypothetical protein